ncbi:MAG: hypothetical protein M0Q53_20595 [Prolixibacteraceae bacterium]|jgi:hypothetical protein|nr:hypothetical protein [Prolixibacteraceae bacterium]
MQQWNEGQYWSGGFENGTVKGKPYQSPPSGNRNWQTRFSQQLRALVFAQNQLFTFSKFLQIPELPPQNITF